METVTVDDGAVTVYKGKVTVGLTVGRRYQKKVKDVGWDIGRWTVACQKTADKKLYGCRVLPRSRANVLKWFTCPHLTTFSIVYPLIFITT
jgi:hypothetical protein